MADESDVKSEVGNKTDHDRLDRASILYLQTDSKKQNMSVQASRINSPSLQ